MFKIEVSFRMGESDEGKQFCNEFVCDKTTLKRKVKTVRKVKKGFEKHLDIKCPYCDFHKKSILN